MALLRRFYPDFVSQPFMKYDMTEEESKKPVERLFPFALRARILIPGRQVVERSRSNLHFVLITDDISDNSRSEILKFFAPYPIIQHYSSADLAEFFNLRNTRVLGFAKGGLAKSIYQELREFRINMPT